MLIVHPPYDCRRIDEGVNFKVHAQPQNKTSQPDSLPLNSPQQGHCQNAQQSFRAAPRANRRDHRIPQPNGSKRAGPLDAHAPLLRQHSDNQPSGEQVRQRKDDFSKREELGRGRGDEHPCEQRRVAVCFSVIGAEALRYIAGGVGEDEVVDVGVFDGGVGVLPDAVEEEDEAEKGGN